MSKLTKLTKAVPAKNAVASKKVVPAKKSENSRFFTTPTYGDLEGEGNGWDELLAEFYIQSRDVSGTSPVIDPINIEKLINMVGLVAVARSGINSDDYLVRQSFTGGDVSGQYILNALSTKYIERTKNSLINDLLNITHTYSDNSANADKYLASTKYYLFEDVEEISEGDGTILGNILTWGTKKITINVSNFTTKQKKDLLVYIIAEHGGEGYESQGLITYRLLTGDTQVDPSVVGAIPQILAGIPLDKVTGLVGENGLTLKKLMESTVNFTDVFDENDVPDAVDRTDYYFKVRIALGLWGEEGDVLSYLIANVSSGNDAQKTIFKAVLDEFDDLADGYLYGLPLRDRVELLADEDHEILAYILNENEKLTDLIGAIYEHKDTTPLTPTDNKTGLSSLTLERFAIMKLLNNETTHDNVTLTYQMLGSDYYVLFKVERDDSGAIELVKSKVNDTVYVAENFTSPDKNTYLTNATIYAILKLLGVSDEESIVLSVNGFSAANNTVAKTNFLTLVSTWGLPAMLKLEKGNWSNDNTPHALFLMIVGTKTDSNANVADKLMKYSKQFVQSLLSNKNALKALQEKGDSAGFATNDELKNGLLRLIDHGANVNDIYQFLGTTDAKRNANVKTLAGEIHTDPESPSYTTVDWKNVNGLIVKAGISTFIDSSNGRMTVGDDATMADNWVLAFADSAVSEYIKLKDSFTAGELLTYNKTTKVYRVRDGRAVLGLEENTLAFNIEKILLAYNISFKELQAQAALADVSLEQ